MACNPKKFKTLQIQINSPFSCYNEIEVNTDGSGISMLGYLDTAGKKTIIRRNEFVIRNEGEKIKIDSLMHELQIRPLVLSGIGHDLYRFVVKIDGEKLVDIYGHDSLVDNVLIVLLPYVKEAKSGECDFFNLFDQIRR